MNVEASGRFRNFPQPVFVEPRFHDLPVLILHEIRPAIRARHRDERAVRRTEPDGENPHRAVQLFGGFHRVLVQFLAIGEKDERAVVALAFAKSLDRRLDRRRDVRAAARDDVGVEFAERVEHRAVIDRQRRLQKRAARKSDQPRAVALELADQILRRQLRAPEPVRREVGGEHAFRAVDGEDHVAPFALTLLPSVAHPRLRQRGDHARQPEQHEQKAEAPFPHAHAPRQPILQPRRHEQPQQLHAPRFALEKERDEHGEEREGPEPDGSAEGHGEGKARNPKSEIRNKSEETEMGKTDGGR